MVAIYIQRKAEKINRLAMPELEITALKEMKALALEFLKGAAPHPPSAQIYKCPFP